MRRRIFLVETADLLSLKNIYFYADYTLSQKQFSFKEIPQPIAGCQYAK
jgi:hypothetical protein